MWADKILKVLSLCLGVLEDLGQVELLLPAGHRCEERSLDEGDWVPGFKSLLCSPKLAGLTLPLWKDGGARGRLARVTPSAKTTLL